MIATQTSQRGKIIREKCIRKGVEDIAFQPKRSKYNTKQGKGQKVTIDGYVFDSRMEANYYTNVLRPKVRKGIVKSFTVHPKYILQDKFVKNGQTYRAITYEADFEEVYADHTVIVDVKGMETQQGLMRRKMFHYRYRDKELIWIAYSARFGGWVEYDQLKKMKKEAKKKESVKEC